MVIRSWSETLEEAQAMCVIENFIAHDFIPDPHDMMENWSLRNQEYFHDKLVAKIDGQIVGCMHIGQGRKENSHIFFRFICSPRISASRSGYRII